MQYEIHEGGGGVEHAEGQDRGQALRGMQGHAPVEAGPLQPHPLMMKVHFSPVRPPHAPLLQGGTRGLKEAR